MKSSSEASHVSLLYMVYQTDRWRYYSLAQHIPCFATTPSSKSVDCTKLSTDKMSYSLVGLNDFSRQFKVTKSNCFITHADGSESQNSDGMGLCILVSAGVL